MPIEAKHDEFTDEEIRRYDEAARTAAAKIATELRAAGRFDPAHPCLCFGASIQAGYISDRHLLSVVQRRTQQLLGASERPTDSAPVFEPYGRLRLVRASR